MNTIDELLSRGRQVTQNYIDRKGEWCLNEQLLHIYEEIGELHRAESVDTKKALEKRGKKGDTYDDIIQELLK